MQFIYVILKCIFVFLEIVLVLIWGVMGEIDSETFMKALEQLEVDSFANILIAGINPLMMET